MSLRREASLPPSVVKDVTTALAGLGVRSEISSVHPVGGGCINHGARITTDRGTAYFLKWNAAAPAGLFAAEADGLRTLAAPGAIRVPEPLALGGAPDSPSWLLMEYISPGRPARDRDTRLGHGLAAIHGSAPRDSRFGWEMDNWIGSLAQLNLLGDSWSAFWRDRRIVPQLEAAQDSGFFVGLTGGVMERLLERIPRALADVDAAAPSLLHGDLWSGNAYAGEGGEPVLIDPAVYRGHGEVDLAMSELFGGFGPGFYAAYAEAAGIPDAYYAYRRDLYQLYYLLVHVNLFGSSYVAGSLTAARRVLTALG